MTYITSVVFVIIAFLADKTVTALESFAAAGVFALLAIAEEIRSAARQGNRKTWSVGGSST